MERRIFGRSNESVSVIGVGTYYDTIDTSGEKKVSEVASKEEKIEGIKRAVELGINLIDTAESYTTEPLVREAVKDFKRDDLFIATKVWPNHLRYDDVIKAARRSLERLSCRYIDLYQIHWPNPKVPIKETMRAMEKLVSDGIIRYIGVSNFSLEELKEAREALTKSEIISNQLEYSLQERSIEKEMLPYTQAENIAVLAYRPIGHGKLANPSGKLGSCIEKMAEKYGKTNAQIAINWLLNKSNLVFPIPRVSSAKRAEENAGAVGWYLSYDDVRFLDKCSKEGFI
ncbi:MAG: aldo/keto reductase [Nitrososphaerota archaeon]